MTLAGAVVVGYVVVWAGVTALRHRRRGMWFFCLLVAGWMIVRVLP